MSRKVGETMYQPWPYTDKKRTIQRDANFVGLILIALLVTQLVLPMVISRLRASGVLNIEAMDNTTYLFFSMGLYITYAALPAVVVALITRRRQNPFPTRRVSAGGYVLALFGGMAMAVAAIHVASFVMEVLTLFGIPYPQFPQTQSGTPTSLVLNLVSTAVLPALLEEMVMRGYVLGALRRYGDKLAVILSAALFGLIHGNVLQLPFAFVLGLVFGWLVVQTGSIWPSVVLHFGNNAMAVLLDYVELAVGSSTAATVLTFMTLCLLGMLVFTAAFLSNKKRGEDLLRPVGNGVATLSVSERVVTILTSPAMIVGVIAWCVMLVVWI